MKVLLATLAAAALFATGISARADSLLTVSDLSGSNNAVFKDGVLSITNIPITMNLYAPNSYTGSPDAVLNFSATETGSPGSLGIISFADVNAISFSITAGATNILSGTAGVAAFFGTASSVQLDSENALGDDITYTSDVFNLANLTKFAFQFNLVDLDPGLSINSNNTLSDFNAAIAPITFSATPVPLPATASMGLTTLLGLGALSMWRKRACRA